MKSEGRPLTKAEILKLLADPKTHHEQLTLERVRRYNAQVFRDRKPAQAPAPTPKPPLNK